MEQVAVTAQNATWWDKAVDGVSSIAGKYLELESAKEQAKIAAQISQPVNQWDSYQFPVTVSEIPSKTTDFIQNNPLLAIAGVIGIAAGAYYLMKG